jgi:hypothetical protein
MLLVFFLFCHLNFFTMFFLTDKFTLYPYNYTITLTFWLKCQFYPIYKLMFYFSHIFRIFWADKKQESNFFFIIMEFFFQYFPVHNYSPENLSQLFRYTDFCGKTRTFFILTTSNDRKPNQTRKYNLHFFPNSINIYLANVCNSW